MGACWILRVPGPAQQGDGTWDFFVDGRRSDHLNSSAEDPTRFEDPASKLILTTMSLTFDRPVGARPDVKELEYILTLHQTAPVVRSDCSIHGKSQETRSSPSCTVLRALPSHVH